METKGNKLGEQGGINLDQTLPGLNPEEVAAVIISDDDDTDFPIDTPQAVSTPKVEPEPEASLGGQESPLISSKEVSYRRKGEESTSS